LTLISYKGKECKVCVIFIEAEYNVLLSRRSRIDNGIRYYAVDCNESKIGEMRDRLKKLAVVNETIASKKSIIK